MLKLSNLKKITVLTLVLISFNAINLSANEVTAKTGLVNFLQKRYGSNPMIQNFKAEISTSAKIESASGWYGFAVTLSGLYNNKGSYQPFSERQTFFTNGEVFTPDLISLKNGRDLKSLLAPKVTEKHYNSHNLLFGSATSKHKIVIFSDPLCPYCQRTVPQLLLYVKQYPKTFAVYYYHLPLEQIHPASVPLTKLMRMAQDKNNPNAVISGYYTQIDAKSNDINKIIAKFNELTGSKITKAEFESQKNVLDGSIKHDKIVANELAVRGTPTIYFDGEKTNSRDFYRSVKVVD
jgi:thiol-disulfide isomerase/thioredoxin